MKIASLIFVILFGLASFVHLYFCYIEDEHKRHLSKPFCLLFLTLAAIFYNPLEPFIYLGALFSLIGDFLLLFKKNTKVFLVGTGVFYIAHIMYMIAGFRTFSSVVPYYVYIIIPFAIILVAVLMYPLTKSIAPKIAIIGNVYMTTLISLIILGIFIAIFNNVGYGLMFLFGYLIFFFSDALIIFTKFKKDIKRRDFYIMVLYLVAEILIVISLSLALA